MFSVYQRQPPQTGQSLSLARPSGSADAWLIGDWAAHIKAQGPRVAGAGLLLVCEQASEALRLTEEIPFFHPQLKVKLLPDWETLPYEAFSPHQDLVSERLLALYEACTGQTDILALSASTALQYICPTEFLASQTFFFRIGQKISADVLRTQLQTAGYSPVTQVVSPGEYAWRGGLIDLFPTGSALPYRIELTDDEVETLRVFNPDSQRTIHPVSEIRILPGREFPSDPDSAARFRARWREVFEGDPSRCSLYKDAGKNLFSAGIEYYLPLLFDRMATVTDYLAPQAGVVLLGNVDHAFAEFHANLESRFRFLKADIDRPVLPPKEIYCSAESFFHSIGARARLSLGGKPEDSPIAASPDVSVDRKSADPVAKLRQLIDRRDGQQLIMTAESPGRRETLAHYLREHGLTPALAESLSDAQDRTGPITLVVAPLHAGFVHSLSGRIFLTENEFFSQVVRRRRTGTKEIQTNVDALIRDLSELKIGDPVVHVQHGIGRYLGLVHMNLGDGDNEFLHLQYAASATLYVPVSQLHVISRYSGANPESAPLHTLGSGQWEKARKKAARQARDTAAELLNVYARRAARTGHAFSFDHQEYERFADGFDFEETPDQLSAIHAVTQDMISGKPMDRLICGDVGFGKTEVALRAAFMAVMDGKQVAVLTPTTLLAEQHFQTFKDRFAQWPVVIAELSRFRSAKEIQSALAGLAAGKVDIAIGTHKLISQGVKFDRLGLVIIDEEHRFGVRQKETLKALRAEVDVLTLTATPIPRTLAMSMEGIRDFSVIATAPQRRLAIKTFVRTESDGIVREALLRELRRGGQAYVLHNQVETIENRRLALSALVPEARIDIAHGQLHERDLERVMRDFHAQRINVLLCSTIIETGIDVPTANTIVIYRADRFGLAQLHQLRGRVGRSHHQAYAYLLTPGEGAMTRDAQKRLEAIQAMEELGSGFFLAMHDLEIRGAGEVLGENQSGNITEVGFQLYADMLAEAVVALKSGREPDLESPLSAMTEINLHAPALLPADYCGDIQERLTLYKRLASAAGPEELRLLEEELIDRFGILPQTAKNLLETHRLRIFVKPHGILKIDATAEAVVMTFGRDSKVDPAKAMALMGKDSRVKFSGADRLRFEIACPEVEGRVRRIREWITAICTL